MTIATVLKQTDTVPVFPENSSGAASGVPNTEPFDCSERSVYLGSLGTGCWFAFNYAKPSGVVLLSAIAAARLRDLLESDGGQSAKAPLPAIDAELARRGLIGQRGSHSGAQPTALQARKEKALNVWINSTNACNFSCHYCYIPHLAKGANEAAIEQLSLPKGAISRILQRLFSFCEANGFDRLHLKLAGGEPTLNLPSLEHFCSEAASYSSPVRVSFGMISNGSFEVETVLPFLKRYRIKPSISVDGIGTTHDQVRHLAIDTKPQFSSWQRIADTTERLCQEGLPPYFLFTLTSANLEDLNAFAEWCHSRCLGFRLSLVRQHIPPGPAFQKRMASALVSLYRQLGESMPVNLRFERDAHFAEWNLAKQKLSACGSCRNYVAIDHQGQVSSCQMTMDTPQGDLTQDSLAAIMASFHHDPQRRLLANPNLKTGGCRRCRYIHVCGGGCPEHTRQVFQTSDTPSPWCSVYGTLAPVYIEAAARHLLRKALAFGTVPISGSIPVVDSDP